MEPVYWVIIIGKNQQEWIYRLDMQKREPLEQFARESFPRNHVDRMCLLKNDRSIEGKDKARSLQVHRVFSTEGNRFRS